jgi:hypothetical protein
MSEPNCAFPVEEDSSPEPEAPKVHYCEDEMVNRLAVKFCAPAWAFFRQVGNSTGSNCRRHIDAVAMCIWPSRGYEIHGFEVKCSRSDLVRELAQPEKADDVAGHCDFFWLVLNDKRIVNESVILPDGWGVMAPRGKGLTVVKKASRIEAPTITRGFVAALLRRAWESTSPESRLEAAKKKSFEEGRTAGFQASNAMIEDAQTKHRALAKEVSDFESAAGITLCSREWRSGPGGAAVGTLLRTILDGGYKVWGQNLDNLMFCLKGVMQGVAAAKSAIDTMACTNKDGADRVRDESGPDSDAG